MTRAGDSPDRPTGAAGARAAWGTMSRTQVIDQAARMLAGEGVEGLTIRALARALGVAPMSIYRHVSSKDDLLDEVVDRLLDSRWRPAAPPNEWQRWIAEAADRLRDFLVGEPAALHVYLRHPVSSPAALSRMDEMVRVLAAALGDSADAERAYAAIHTYTVGFAALEAARSVSVLNSEAGHELADRLASYSTPRQFDDGLKYLLRGIVSSTCAGDHNE